jgi:hypothetical protein
MLLQKPAVQEDLKISAEQQAKLESLFEDIVNREHGFGGPGHSRPDTKELLQEMKAHERGIARILTEQQQLRLRQIGYQVRGINVFQEPEVVAALKLTRKQRDEIHELCRRPPMDFDGGPGGRGGPGRGPGRGLGMPPERMWDGPPEGRGGMRPFGRGGRPDAESQWHEAMDILTPEQRERWNELVGPKFATGPGDMRGRRFGPFDH